MDITIIDVFIVLVVLAIVISLFRGIVTVAFIGLAILFAYYSGILTEVISIIVMLYEQFVASSGGSVAMNIASIPFYYLL